MVEEPDEAAADVQILQMLDDFLTATPPLFDSTKCSKVVRMGAKLPDSRPICPIAMRVSGD